MSTKAKTESELIEVRAGADSAGGVRSDPEGERSDLPAARRRPLSSCRGRCGTASRTR
jgi:hypothetical protein